MSTETTAMLALVAALVATALGAALYIYYGRLLMRSRVAGVPVPLSRMFRMTIDRIDAYVVVTEYIRAHQAGLGISLDEIEAQARTGVDVRDVIQQRLNAKRAAMGKF